MKKYILLMLIVISSLFSYSQGPDKEWTTKNKKAIGFYSESTAFIQSKQYKEAIEILNMAIKYDANFIEAYERIGDIYRVTKNDNLSKQYYTKVNQMNPNMYPMNYYFLGDIEMKKGNYSEAKPLLEKFISTGYHSNEYSKIAKKQIQDCIFAEDILAKDPTISPRNLGKSINTKDDEYLASITSDGKSIIFTRKINDNEDFYSSKRTGKTWSQATPLVGKINSPEFNEGAQSISPDGQFIFFTICNNPKGQGRCDIYYSQLKGDSWSAPKNIGAPINTGSWESQPCLSSDGRTLYFASDRRGSIGKIDIWRSYLQDNGKWSEPENLGPNINTYADEQSPFIHPDSETLYFASEGLPGMGQCDIYMSRLDTATNKWQSAINMGFPINSYTNDFGLVINGHGELGYFASNNMQVGQNLGKFDLYEFNVPDEYKPKPIVFIKGLVYDNKKPELKLNAVIEIQDLSNGKTIFRSESNSKTGVFLATLPMDKSYAINVSKDGYLFYSEHIKITPELAYKEIEVNANMKGIDVGESIILKNIFFETNSYKLSPYSVIELNRVIAFMKKYPKVAIEISGHTDDIGNNEDNMKLSEGRARSVYGYLIRAIPHQNRFKFVGRGENNPIAPNDTEEGRARNRRTELKITSITMQ